MIGNDEVSGKAEGKKERRKEGTKERDRVISGIDSGSKTTLTS